MKDIQDRYPRDPHVLVTFQSSVRLAGPCCRAGTWTLIRRNFPMACWLYAQKAEHDRYCVA